MQCRNCGTEIADKAIVCYRCGTPTTDPVRRPATPKPKRSPLLSFVAVLVLLALALYLGVASRTSAHPEPLRTGAGVLVGAVVVVLVVRILRRRQA